MYRFGYDDYSNYQLYAQNKGGTYFPTGFMRTSTGSMKFWIIHLPLPINRILAMILI